MKIVDESYRIYSLEMEEVEPLRAQQVSDYIINSANRTGQLITNLKLQKLLYYAQGYYLAVNNKILFSDNIEAWVHGPVVADVYQQYKHFRWAPISTDVGKPLFSKKIKDFLDIIIETFLPMDSYKLELMTHQESPWKNARGDLAPSAICRRIIKIEDMKEYFSKLMSDGQK